jgi:CheY-like chemotaxis protein
LSTLVVSMNEGLYPLHKMIAPLLNTLGVSFQTVHDQESAKAFIEGQAPRLLLMDVFVPASPPAGASRGEPIPQISNRAGVQRVELPGLTGVRVSSLFTDTLELAKGISAAHPETAMVTLYSVRSGMPKSMKLALESLPSYKGYFGYPLTEANQKKLSKVIKGVLGLP